MSFCPYSPLFFQKRLANAKVFIAQNNGKAFYDETIKALWGYFSNKLHITQSALTKENIREVLTKHQVSQETAENTMQLLNTCEISLFAPQQSADSLESVYTAAIELITKLDNEII